LLNIDAGAGRHQLMISDEAAILADGTIEQRALITDQPRRCPSCGNGPRHRRGRSLARPTSTSSGSPLLPSAMLRMPDGNFLSGVTYWTGFGGRPRSLSMRTHSRPIAGAQTVTSLNTGLGNDNVMITAGQRRRLLCAEHPRPL